jgi:ATP-dependent helicase YprA (DUF1998 family)
MSSMDPVAVSRDLEEAYVSYLLTTFGAADASLRHELEVQLRNAGRTRKGPILQASPPYAPGRSLQELVDSGALHRDLLALSDDVLPSSRPLYLHQERAIERARSGRNLVVATGTGSGKTECYLLPVIDSLLREREAGTLSSPGVRALLLYPMNALANDQMKRIRSLLGSFPEITFGRYIGDTEANPAKALDRFVRQHRSQPLANELIDRQSMQQHPPHVLLTNYAMLEYLLLRPRDSAFFDGATSGHWRFLVLDELHVYDGARGAEVGMLLRRVRDRVNGTLRGQLTCIGTSATLGGGEQSIPRVADFARAIFDETFETEDVIGPTRLPLVQSDARWALDDCALREIHDRWSRGESGERLIEAIGGLKAVVGSEESEPSRVLWDLLQDESHVVLLQQQLEDGSIELSELAATFPSFADPAAAAVRLLELCLSARPSDDAAPLIPARYHVFLRASEGAFSCRHPRHPQGKPRLILDRHVDCPACAEAGISSHMFELGVCRHCGADYAIGVLDDEGALEIAPAHVRALTYLLPEAAAFDGPGDEDEEAVSGVVDDSLDAAALCAGCGVLGGPSCACGAGARVPVRVAKPAKGAAELRRCVACGRHSTVSVVLRFLSGSEAPVSVLATSLYQALPESPEMRHHKGGGRKLLMFSDSRQDAAFFAPYLARTYDRAVERRLIWSVLSGEQEAISLDDLVQPLRRVAERTLVLDEEDGRTNVVQAKTWLLAEVLSTDRRQSLDGLGLAEIAPMLPRRFASPSALLDVGLTEDEALDVVRVLLESLRQAAAVTVPDDVNVKEDLRFAPRNTTTWVRGEGSEPRVLAWLPSRGLNRRLDFVEKVLQTIGSSADARALLRTIWVDLTLPGGALERVLTPLDQRNVGTVFALNHERLGFSPASPELQPSRCDRCRQVWWRDIRGVCPTYRCSGTLFKLGDAERNHYRGLYENLKPIGLSVEEHTGQLRTSRAAELQEQFTRGEVNALSCSTTFELGVDVGDVQAVLMRNVPPSPSNYVQRAGRAGRRAAHAAMIVTFAQRRSHDLHFFNEPDAMVDGHVSAPVIAMDNDQIARRHVHAVAFAQFERRRINNGEAPLRSSVDFFDGYPDGGVCASFVEWLGSKPRDLEAAVARIVPDEVRDALGIQSWSWANRLVEPDEDGVGGWLAIAADDLARDRAELSQLEATASAERKHGLAGAIARTLQTIEERRLLDVLAQRGVLPKYGFPVDVVELNVSRSEQARNIELDRDLRLAILEYAPGAKVVASNRLWRSTGLRTHPGRRLPMHRWGVCDGCGALRSKLRAANDEAAVENDEPCPHCGNSNYQRGRRGQFIVPLFGFVGVLDDERPGETRPPREGFLETFFADFDGSPPELGYIDLGAPAPMQLRVSKRGWITVFNRGRTGQGFRVCFDCGYATDGRPTRSTRARSGERPAHERPYSSDKTCTGTLYAVDLGHRFLTNVLELVLPLPASSIDERDAAARSALEALVAAMPSIGISQQDIGGSLAIGIGGERTVVLYDEVPGGAGHTRFVRENLAELFEQALARAATCSCGEDTSCYGCLRSYRNQKDHDALQRGLAIEVLERSTGRRP